MKSHTAPVIPKTLKINFPASASKKKLRLASFCSLVWPTTGSECDYWQTTSHISTALGFTLHVWSTLFLLSFCSHFYQRAKVSVRHQNRFVSWEVSIYCRTCLTRSMLKDPEKTHRVQYKPGISQTMRSFLASQRVHSVTQASTCFIHTGMHHTNKLECTLTTVKKATHALDWLWSHNRALLF